MRILMMWLLATLSPLAWSADWQTLAGAWQGEGSLFQTPVTATLAFQPAVGKRFVRQTYQVRSGDGQLMFEAEGIYQREGTQGRWFDSAGHLYVIQAQWTDSGLRTTWGDPAIEQGRSHYQLEEGGRLLRVRDEVWKAEQWQVFAEIVYRRTDLVN